VAELLRRIDETVPGGPAAFVRSLDSAEGSARGKLALQGFVHRFNVGEDFYELLVLLGRSWREYGSLGGHFLAHLKADDAHIGPALDALIADWKSWRGSAHPGSFDYLLTSPKDGSCCKRWCMFLRWVGRRDSLDLGLWAEGGAMSGGGRHLRADQLVIPLDTHTGRISQYLGLTKRKSLNWLAAVEVTETLKVCRADDPTRYDFAISRLGILDLCQKKFRVEICGQCQLQPVCHFAQARSRSASTRARR
jgi:uncharacterized protein (TIGR02757 family)